MVSGCSLQGESTDKGACGLLEEYKICPVMLMTEQLHHAAIQVKYK